MSPTTTPPPEPQPKRRGRGVLARLGAALLAVGVLMAALALALPLARHPFVLLSLAREEPSPTLPVPVRGVRPRQLADTWGAARSGGRRHQGIDILAPRGTDVLSTTRGIVVDVGTNRLGGNVVRVLGPGLEWHYYAHLDSYGAYRPGDLVEPGSVLGHVGDTGNARGTPPHLHYGIYEAIGSASNPHPRLVPQR